MNDPETFRAEARLREVQQMSASEEMFPIVNRELFDAVVALNAANGVKANELNHILQDLITELRGAHAKQFPEHETYDKDWLRAWYCCAIAAAADRAEGRLREVSE